MKVKEAISRVRNTVKEFSGDARTSARYLWNVIWTNSMFLLEKEKNLSTLDIFKTVDLDVETVNLLKDSCVPLNCEGYRVKLPSGSEGKKGLIYRYIASPDLSNTFKLVTPTSFKRKKSLRGDHSNYAFLDSGYLYIDKYFPCIKLSYLPDSSEEAISDDGCSLLEQESPLPDYLLRAVFKMSYEELFPNKQIPLDTIQNKNPNN